MTLSRKLLQIKRFPFLAEIFLNYSEYPPGNPSFLLEAAVPLDRQPSPITSFPIFLWSPIDAKEMGASSNLYKKEKEKHESLS